MARRGRPRGVSSIETKHRIISAAREEFSQKGYDGASVSSIALKAQLAPSAIYNHYETKTKLYIEVFEDSANTVWADVSLDIDTTTLVDAVSELIEKSRTFIERMPHHSNFLACAPVHARLYPEFLPLLDRRTNFQDKTFTALATLGVRTGELEGFSIEEGKELLRALIMGWFFERHFRDKEIAGNGEEIVKVIKVLADS